MWGNVSGFAENKTTPPTQIANRSQIESQAPDKANKHIFQKEENQIIAYTRVFKKGDYYSNPSIGRVVVKKTHRGKDYGKRIMETSIKYVKNNLEGKLIELSAQKYLDKFYRDLGFYKTGKDYLEDGIPHQRMIKEIN